MKELGPDATVTIQDVLGVDLCARAILDYVPVRELVRSERVCKRWQGIVISYLRTCHHTDILYNVYNFYLKSFRVGCPKNYVILRPINIYFAHESLLLTCKALHKIGPPKEKVSDHYFNNISSRCPYLRHLYSLSPDEECFENSTELKISKLIRDKRKSAFCTSKPRLHLTGDMLKHIKSNELPLEAIRFSIYGLRNVTTLELDDHNIIKRDYVHFLLNAMPHLENLSFCNYTCKFNSIIYNDPYVVSDDQLIESISRLAYLKSLHMRNNTIVNDELLKALVRCKELKYLDISYDNIYKNWPKKYSARGVALLCSRSPSAITTLCFGYIKNFTAQSMENYIRAWSVIRELENLGCCVELKARWLEDSLALQAKMQPLELRVKNASWFNPSQSQPTKEINNLKIVLNTDVHAEQLLSDLSL